MKIQVVSAIGGGIIEVDISPSSTVLELKRLVASEKRIPAATVIIVFRGQQLDDGEILKSAGVTENDRCYLITRTEGGL